MSNVDISFHYSNGFNPLGACHWWRSSEVRRKDSTSRGNSDVNGGMLDGSSRQQTNGTSVDNEVAGHSSCFVSMIMSFFSNTKTMLISGKF